MLVSSVPLSLTTVHGLPRRAMMASSSRATRTPDRDVSPTPEDAGTNKRQTFTRKVVDHGEDAETATIGKGVRDKVQAPALVRSLRQSHGNTRTQRPFAPNAAADLEALFGIKPPQLFVVHPYPRATEADWTCNGFVPVA